ncbi:thioredoxin-like protein [Achlya hypogyna]|uniref:Thioredoxin-like protein n=1 Tax=Achlya hypogyna TaxID=1202772 RepID=A0A1V9ZTI0_ACHHY|nr:thioredoxin-like protein [Achlya hypogyna]
MRRVIAAAKNGVAFPCEADGSAFILGCPKGVYSGARTVHSKFVFALESHLKRLVQPTTGIIKDASDDELVAMVKPRVLSTLRAAMDDLHRDNSFPAHQEYKLTLVMQPSPDATSMTQVIKEPGKGDVLCHIGLMGSKEGKHIKVEVAGTPRQNPLVKDLQWAKDRQALYDAMSPDTEELILMDPASRLLYEASQSNFFVVQDDVVVTADDGILKGTMRDLVLESCEALGIPVRLAPPAMDDVDRWSGAFLTSTSRFVLPIQHLVYATPAHKNRDVRFGTCPVVERLKAHVLAAVASHATQVFD